MTRFIRSLLMRLLEPDLRIRERVRRFQSEVETERFHEKVRQPRTSSQRFPIGR
jgi:hypothetical protein